LTSPESGTSGAQQNLPFGALPDADGDQKRRRTRRGGRRRRRRKPGDQEGEDGAEVDSEGGSDEGSDERQNDRPNESSDDSGEAPSATRNEAQRGPRGGADASRAEYRDSAGDTGGPGAPGTGKRRRRGRKRDRALDDTARPPGGDSREHAEHGGQRPPRPGYKERPDGARRPSDSEIDPESEVADTFDPSESEGELPGDRDPRAKQPLPREAGGMLVIDKGGIGLLRQEEYQWLPSKWDIYVPKRLVQVYKLHDGMLVHGRVSKGFKHKLQLDDVLTIDGKEPKAWKNKLAFHSLTSVDPDFHYAIGDETGEVAMRVVDLLAPIGRGQRALLVAPPRTGKTTILRQFAAGIEKAYTDVHLFVLLIDERPEEATEWKRSVERGKVFVSTSDETAKHHIEVAEMVWRRVCRLVECGEDVVLLLDSITRLARAFNNQAASGGRTMSGGLDSRAMERPRKIFGSARNTVEAGSLTIVGTCLIDTGSRLDQLVFEEFKGTGNSEIVLSRKLADRRIFPAIDVEKSGTRKEEKLLGMKRLRQVHTLRRVLNRMHFAEAMDLLVTRLGEAEKTSDFLERFTIDPEA